MNSFAYNGRFLGRAATGVDRFAAEVMRHVVHARPAAAWDTPVFVPRVARSRTIISPSAHAHVVSTGTLHGQLWEQIELPRAIKDRPLVNLCNTAPAWRENQLVVIHDAATLANPQNFSAAFRTWYRWLLGSLMRRSRVVTTVSSFSADELSRYFGRRARGIEVMHEGGEHILRKAADATVISRFGLEGRRFVMALGNRSPNKNLVGIQAALNLIDDPDLVLVAVGGANAKVFADVKASEARTLYTGYLCDAELRALYEHAQCFVFPSFYEGFGLPPLEAMCCGCPTIVSNRSSMPEVCADAALYCDPSDPASIAAAMRRVLVSQHLRDDLRDAGLVRARAFSWRSAGKQLADLMDQHFDR